MSQALVAFRKVSRVFSSFIMIRELFFLRTRAQLLDCVKVLGSFVISAAMAMSSHSMMTKAGTE